MTQTSKKKWPTTARELLEARYQAFVEGNVDFILESCHPEVREKQEVETIRGWSQNSKWLGLTIEKEEADEEISKIVFQVDYEEQGKRIEHRESAYFKKHNGQWFYFDSEFAKPKTFQREEPKVGRNDPCSCGSGKKFKKCCG